MFTQKPDLKLVCAKHFADNKIIGAVIAELGSTASQHAALADEHLMSIQQS